MKIGWIGTGVMGFHMAKHLMNNGHKLMVYNRTPSKAKGLIDLGATFANPKEIAQTSDILFTMLGFPQDMKDLFFNERNFENKELFGIFDDLKNNSIIIDHSTNCSEFTKNISTKLKEKSIDFIDAPVSGGDIGAKNGKLIIMCGGNKNSYDKVEPLMKNYASNIQYFGENPSGQIVKLGNQIKVACTMIGLVESLYFIEKAGVDKQQFINLIKEGAANSFSLQSYGNRLIKEDFEPGFYVDMFVKDLKLCLDQCEILKINLPGLKICYDLYKKLNDNGYGKLGSQALWKVYKDIK